MPHYDTSHLPGPHPIYYEGVMELVMAPILATHGGVQYRGAEVLQEIEGPYILAPVHRALIDTLVTAHIARETAGTQVHFMGKESLFKNPVLAKLIELGAGFPVDRSKPIPPETLAHVAVLAEGNAAVGVFPESTREEGRLFDITKLKRGGVPLLASTLGMTIVPIGIAGTEKGDRLPIRAVVGEPIPAEKMEGRAMARQAKELSEVLGVQLEYVQYKATEWRLESPLHRALEVVRFFRGAGSEPVLDATQPT